MKQAQFCWIVSKPVPWRDWAIITASNLPVAVASVAMFSMGETVFRLASALAIGLLMGAERERRKGEGPYRAAAGIRTFAVSALIGGVSVVLGGHLLLAVAAVIVAFFSGLAYIRTHDEDPGLTSEAALVLAVLLGGLAQTETSVLRV